MVQLFLCTANLGSVFENIEVGLPTWINEVISTVQTQNPAFVALHFQETGGKGYKNGSPLINTFFSELVENFRVIGFHLVEGFIDSDSDSDQHWTALSNAYFVKANLAGVQIWDFKDRSFVPINTSNSIGRLYSGNELYANGRKQKFKFPLHFFPNMKYSRKGILRTRWSIQGTVIDLVNIHLFHDLSNLVAASAYPSPFSQNRQRGLNHVLENFKNDDLEQAPLFMFGDFNFRLNSFDLFELLRREAAAKEMSTSADAGCSDSELVIDTKKFVVEKHEERFKHDWAWLKPYDFEAANFEDLTELEVKFHPTYPFDEECSEKFMRTRPPAWCDRVLFSQTATDIISKESHSEYNLIGSEVCMGDHKPVYLTFDLKPSADFDTSADLRPIPNFSFKPTTAGNSGSKVCPPEILPNKPCRIVSFLRGNLSLNNGPHNNPCSNHPKSMTTASTTTSNFGSGSGSRKCCFLKIRAQPPSSETEVLTTNNGRLGRQNMLLSNELESSNSKIGLGLKDELNKRVQESEGDCRVIVLNNDNSMKAGQSSNDSGSIGNKLCPGCTIL